MVIKPKEISGLDILKPIAIKVNPHNNRFRLLTKRGIIFDVVLKDSVSAVASLHSVGFR